MPATHRIPAVAAVRSVLARLTVGAVVTLAVVTLAVARPLAAQPALGGCDPDGPAPAFLSVESDVFYGCGSLFRSTTPQYVSAMGRFQAALAKRPDHAIALFLLGVTYAGTEQRDSARVVLERALRLDPRVMDALAPRLAERPALRDRIADVLRGAPAPAATVAPTVAPKAPPALPPTAPAAPAASRALVLGDYTCTYDYWVGPPAARRRQSDPKGSLLLRADGTYRHFDNGAFGRYRYDESTGTITWLTGDLATMRPERTTFRRNRTTAQIDVRLRGDYEWSCGINLP